MAQRVLLGQIVGVHGIRGEVVLKTYTAEPEGIADYGPLSNGNGREFRIKHLRVTGKGVIATLDGVADRTTAETLRGTELFVPRDRLPDPEAGEFYYEDLVGLAAVDPDGTPIGEVVAVHNFGAGDLLEVRMPNRRQTELIPFTDAHVPAIEVAARRVTVILPRFAADEPGEPTTPPAD